MNLSKANIFLLSAAFLLVSCSDQPPDIKPIAAEPDIVTVKLAQAADKAAKSLDVIANIEQQKNPETQPLPNDYAGAPSNLMQPVSLRWSGPIEQASRTLAEHAGMRFRIKGSQPPVPLIVNVDAYQQPILHILRDIGLQAGSRADLNVDANEGVVEIRYAADDRSR
jgi:defect-in-organelle-trafficking protein DotD